MATSSFAARVLQNGKITVPEATRELLGIEEGDLLEVTVQKMVSLHNRMGRSKREREIDEERMKKAK